MEYKAHMNAMKINKIFKQSQLHQKTICNIYITTQQTHTLFYFIAALQENLNVLYNLIMILLL
jgi:hypothetical protein